MREDRISFDGLEIPVISLNTLVVGSGAAGLNCAVHLFRSGQRDVAIITDDLEGGTSRNAGSDKQTYYKLSVSGDVGDSPRQLAETLFSGGSMHGDIALVEATLSAQEFYHLVSLGVPFPHDRFGSFVGYRTDNDPKQRGTSAGPLTSRYMHGALLREVRSLGIRVMDGMEATSLFADGSSVIGALCINRRGVNEENMGATLFNCTNLVLATGGPGDIYRSSVYPESQRGSTGLAIEIGARCANLTEWQFGIASTKFRWNVSGSYQQAIPTYLSMDKSGEEREFLSEFFPSPPVLADSTFAKGYEWPFDARKIAEYGSSLIDLLVHRESSELGRRVLLDFNRNPSGFSLEELGPRAHSYLESSGALLDLPIDRLDRMNPPAIRLYASHGIDLRSEPLEVAVCAQHNNGGLLGSIWWESNVKHLFPVGEVNGSHGVYRPGGAALNSGQVGGLRAAQFISARYSSEPPSAEEFTSAIREDLKSKVDLMRDLTGSVDPGSNTIPDSRRLVQERMTRFGAHVRSLDGLDRALAGARALCSRLPESISLKSREDLPEAFRLIHLARTHLIYLEAMREFVERDGGSRGSSLVLDPHGTLPCPLLGSRWTHRPFDGRLLGSVCEAWMEDGGVKTRWVKVRPLPTGSGWFEEVWREFREGQTFAPSTSEGNN